MYESVSIESGYYNFCINFMSLCTGEKSVVQNKALSKLTGRESVCVCKGPQQKDWVIVCA